MAAFKYRVCLFIAMLLVISTAGSGAEYVLPAGLTEIEEEAFSGNTAFSVLTIPEGVETIGARAFSGCAELNEVFIPSGVTEIGEDAFAQCGEAMLIRCEPGSAALTYTVSHQLDYRANTVCRALIVGQTYTGTTKVLQGPANDQRAVRFCLAEMGWTVNPMSNLSAEGIISAIRTSFADATDRDISLFYYSGHGLEDGSLLGSSGNDSDTVTPAQLRSALDSVPGRKVVVVDACYSGQLIAEDLESSGFSDANLLKGMTQEKDQRDHASQFVAAFQSAFSRTFLRGTLNRNPYFVITAAREYEESAEGYVSSDGLGRMMGYFTNAFCLGLGYNGATMRSVGLYADQNGDGAVSVQEAYQWASRRALEDNPSQHAAVWPEGCRWFAPFRP